jgi:hypothetical protein
MKTKNLVRKLNDLLSAKRRKQLARFESLEKVLRKLKKKEAALKRKLDDESNKERRRALEHKLKVIRAQAKKGRKLRDELAKEQD